MRHKICCVCLEYGHKPDMVKMKFAYPFRPFYHGAYYHPRCYVKKKKEIEIGLREGWLKR